MAITWLENGIEWGAKPSFKRAIGYEETKRTATQVTYKVHLKLKVQGSGTSSSSYGYGINWRVDGGSWLKVKDASPRWYGNEAYREFTTNITKTVTASGGSTTFKVEIDGLHGSSGSPNLSKSYTAKVPTFNTKPTWSSTARLTARENNSSGAIITNELDGTEDTKKITENIGNIYLSWDSASDSENNINKYELYTQVSNGSWSLIYSGSARNYTHNIGSGASTQGRSYDYYVKAVDSYGLTSDSLNLRQFQKNKLTGANLSVNTGINYNTSEITLTWSGASNTNGNSSFTYSVTASNVTIYNKEKLVASGGKIKILKSGTSTEPYVLFSDLQKIVNSSKTGSFDISLVTKNAYGSTATKTAKVSVDLKTPPKAPTKVTVGGKISTSLGSFLIPSKQNATLTWSGAVDNLGGVLTYDVYYKVGTGSEVVVNANTNTSISIKLPTPSSATQVSFRVVAKTSYGLSSSSATVTDTIHFYNPPTVSLNNYNRTTTSMKIDINSKLSTSIPNVGFSKQSFTGNGTTSNFTGTKFTASISNLNDSSAFTFTATINDNTGLSGDVSASYKVTPATPMLSVREKGVGVGVVNNEGVAKLMVKDGIIVTNRDNQQVYVRLDFLNNIPRLRIAGSGTGTTNGFAIQGVGDKQLLQVGDSGNLFLNNKQVFTVTDSWLRINETGSFANGVYFGKSNVRTDGLFQVGEGGTTLNVTPTVFTYKGNKVYHAGAKPTASEIGALPTSGVGTINGRIIMEGDMASDNSSFLRMNTSGDKNGYGDSKTHIGYRSADGNYSHYFRGKGVTNLDTVGGVKVSNALTVGKNLYAGYSIYVGDYEEAYRATILKRMLSTGQKYEARYGISYGTIKQTSESTSAPMYGAVIESCNDVEAQRRYLFSNTGVYPLNDNKSYCGASSHRWQSVYCTTGTVYSSSENEKQNIQSIDKNPATRSISNLDIITDGLKNVNLYTYGYKTLENTVANNFVGFLGQEVEEQNPEFFNLFGSSYLKETEDGEEIKQYDIRETSLNGVLMAGLGEALRKIDLLENTIKEMKGEI